MRPGEWKGRVTGRAGERGGVEEVEVEVEVGFPFACFGRSSTVKKRKTTPISPALASALA